MRTLLVIGAVAAIPLVARAETAVKLQSCSDAYGALLIHQQCMNVWQDASLCDRFYPTPTSQCWDFETGLRDAGFGGWTVSGGAFKAQPTFGDNVTAWRVLQTQASPLHPQSGTVLDDFNRLGGDYWQTAYPIGHQGNYWIGTYERRMTPSSAWGGTQGDAPTGTLTSPAFVADRDYVSFLIGGGCDITQVSVELQVNFAGGWFPSLDPLGRPRIATGSCSELMERKVFYTDRSSGLQGMFIRIVIKDASSGSWGHINVDHILHTNTVPNDFDGANRPLWGFADTHAHLGNHTSFQALSNGGHALDGDPEIPAACDGGKHGPVSHEASLLVSYTAETMSLGTAPRMPEGCSPGLAMSHAGSKCQHYDEQPSFAVGGQYHDAAVGSPYWYTRTHQQMYIDWIERSYRGGQRLLVASAGNSELIGSLLRNSHTDQFVSDYGAMRRFAAYIKDLVTRHSWMEIAYTPADARRIIRANRLAIILQTEVEDIGDNCAASITYSGTDLDGGSTTTTSTNGANPWDQVKVKTSCGTNDADWKTRVASLYEAGYRIIIPIHFANNDLGGTAVYSDMHNTINRFENRSFLNVTTSPSVMFRLGEANRLLDESSVMNFGTKPDPLAAWHAAIVGWCQYSPFGGCFAGAGQAGWLLLGGFVSMAISAITNSSYTPILIDGLSPLPGYNGEGHINIQPLTPQGRTVLQAMKDRGMLIDLAHMGELGRDAVLGLGTTASTSSIVNPGCDMTTAACQDGAYPVIASHAGLRELSPEKDRNEGGLRADMIERIRAIGGTVAAGTAGGDSKSANEASPMTNPATGLAWSGIYASNVVNDCAGSSKTFAQGYLYVLRSMGGRGVTLGTDINGFEAQLNPRFGSMGCYARGNIPRILQFAHDGTLLIDVNHVEAITPRTGVPFNYAPDKLLSAGWLGTAGGQRWLQRESKDLGAGLNYAHYAGMPPAGGPGTSFKFFGLWDPIGYDGEMVAQNWAQPNQTRFDVTSMTALSTSSPMTALTTNGRTFDFNYDGLANYGMLPDALQDSRADGMTQEQLGPLFQGAEYLIETWEKSCRLSNPTLSIAGCK
ncbi:MAG: peptidase [Myxococcales bacterium]|nr:peptidase [Myxococcales bacterium]